MRLSEAGLASNIEYWKRVADRYRSQRDDALREVQALQRELYRTTGKAYDGYDYIRDIQRTKSSHSIFKRIIFLFRRSK